MNYHLHHRGQNVGVFPLEELRRRREAGELNGDEVVWCPGMGDWQPLDSVLRAEAANRSAVQPAGAASTPARRKRNPILTMAVVTGILVAVAGLIGVGLVVFRLITSFQPVLSEAAEQVSETSATVLASQPVTWKTNTVTVAAGREQRRSFRLRQYLEGYRTYGQRDPSCDALAQGLIGNWIASNYGGPVDTNLPSLTELSNKLAADPACADPLVLIVAADNCSDLDETIRRLERAVAGLEHSRHKAYPKLYTTVRLAGVLADDRAGRVPVLDAAALRWLGEALKDGSLQPEDQAEMAESLINEWGSHFLNRNGAAICPIVRAAGKPFQWLALVLEGEFQINEAWKARGGGFVNTVTEEGQRGFAQHLARARPALTQAWELRPDLPLAPTRMMYVALGDSGLEEMRRWFDRAVAAQLDYPYAWSEMRWGLRPRWYGDPESMRAFGLTALRTRRFDTDVPRVLFDSVSDLESELQLPRGRHIYGRDDLWPHLQALYEGYLAAPAQGASEVGWRSAYAAVAYLAGKYDVAQQQLQALNWKPRQWNLSGWGTDLSLMALEVAARTGPLASSVAEAEAARGAGKPAAALQVYTELSASPTLDERTRAFVQDRLVTLTLEREVQQGGWVDFMPSGEKPPGWRVALGKWKTLPDGAIEVQAGPAGHLCYSRARFGTNYEVKGTFEVERTSNGSFDAGLVMGLPNMDTFGWYGFRIRRCRDEKDAAVFSTHWTKGHFLLGPTALNGDTNTFEFRFQNGKVSASVNDRKVFQEVTPPANYDLPGDSFLLGLGAFNDMNDTVIRYRSVQVRKL